MSILLKDLEKVQVRTVEQQTTTGFPYSSQMEIVQVWNYVKRSRALDLVCTSPPPRKSLVRELLGAHFDEQFGS